MELPKLIQSKKSVLLGYFTTDVSQDIKQKNVPIVLSEVAANIDDIAHEEISKRIYRWRNLATTDHEIIVFSNILASNILYSILPMVEEISLVDLGPFIASVEDGVDLKLEHMRRNVMRSCSALCQQTSVDFIEIDPCGHPKEIAGSAVYGIFQRNEIECNIPKSSFFFDSNTQPSPVSVRHFSDKRIGEPTQESLDAFEEGLIIGECQNFARLLHGAGFFITAEEFINRIEEKFSDMENVKFIHRDETWIQNKDMKYILQVAWMNKMCNDQGKYYNSFQQHPGLLEIHYDGCPTSSKPIVLVGRSSFYHLSESYFLTENRQPVHLTQNVSSGASIVATILALARMKIPINVKGIVAVCIHSFSWRKMPDINPLTESDIFSEIPDSHEERLILRDAVLYACSFDPEFVITIATQTTYLTEAFDSGTSVVYSSHDLLAEEFLRVCVDTGERFIRLPFVDIEDDIFYECIIEKQFCSDCKDVLNRPVPPETKNELIEYISENWNFCFITSVCLKTLLKDKTWLHLELNQSLLFRNNDEHEVYVLHEITGSPTRSLISFIQNLVSSESEILRTLSENKC